MKENNICIEIGLRLKDLRKSNDIKVKTLSDMLGVTQASYYAYESATRDIPYGSLIKLAEFYNISVDDLIGHKVAYNRKNTADFECFSESGSVRKVVDQSLNDIVLYERDKYTIYYYLKTSDYNFGRNVLVNENDNIYPAVLNYDEKENLYTVENIVDNKIRILRPQYFKDYILVIGVLAGSINKDVLIDNFF